MGLVSVLYSGTSVRSSVQNLSQEFSTEERTISVHSEVKVFYYIIVMAIRSPIVIHDGIEPVSDGDDCTLGKLGPDGLLDEVVRLQIHGSRSLVQNQHLGLAQQGTGEAHQLTLPHAQVLPSLSNVVLKPLLQRGDESAEVGTFQGTPQLLVLIQVKGVKVQPQSARKENRVLQKITSVRPSHTHPVAPPTTRCT